ncbi:hypothetical protein FB451DRAFT_1164394 [Mycena latifolia]|nr:hypothetical protein FB451DRAFT_1164394 [Mycena latifolia]
MSAPQDKKNMPRRGEDPDWIIRPWSWNTGVGTNEKQREADGRGTLTDPRRCILIHTFLQLIHLDTSIHRYRWMQIRGCCCNLPLTHSPIHWRQAVRLSPAMHPLPQMISYGLYFPRYAMPAMTTVLVVMDGIRGGVKSAACAVAEVEILTVERSSSTTTISISEIFERAGCQAGMIRVGSAPGFGLSGRGGGSKLVVANRQRQRHAAEQAGRMNAKQIS